ncbi:CHAT domain-containing protein [Monashia sp. NPDC004114]
MSRDYLDFDLAVTREGQGYAARVVASPAGQVSAPFTLPFSLVELAQFMNAVGPPRVSSRRLVPAEARVVDVKDYGRRLGDALLAGEVARAFRESLTTATSQGKDLRLRLRLDAVPDLDPVPWEYLYDTRLDRFLALSQETPVVRLIDSADRPPAVEVEPPMRVLVMISSPSDMPELAVEREEQLLRATTGDLVKAGQLEIVVLEDATLTSLQRALLDDYHVFHFIGHGGFDQQAQEGVLVLEREDGTAHRVSGVRLGTLLHDARGLQLAVLNACEGARTSGRDAFSGVGQALVRQGLPAVVAMQTEISDRAALVFSHEFYYFLSRGLGIDAAICEVRKAMAVSDEASEWGTAVLLRSGTDQPFTVTAQPVASTRRTESRLESLYDAAQGALAAQAPGTALPMLEQIAAEQPDYQDVTELIERVRPSVDGGPDRAPAPDLPPGTGGGPSGAHDVGATGVPGGEPQAAGSGGAPPTIALPLTGGEPPHQEGPPPRHEPPPSAEESAHHGFRFSKLVRPLLLLAVIVAALVAWRFLPSLLQKSPLVSVACGSSEQLGNTAGSDFTIGCAPVAPTIDGSFDDWRSIPFHDITATITPSPDRQPGLRGQWQALWDADGLYVHVIVTDDDIRPVQAPASAWFQGDGVSFEIGPDPSKLKSSAPLRPGRDFHVIIGLLENDDRGAAAAINPVGTGRGGVLVFVKGKAHPEITVARRNTSDGYELEAKVPWSSIGRDLAPSRGTVLGLNFNISDAFPLPHSWALRSMLSSNPDRSSDNQNHPGTWQTAMLSDAS